LKHITQENIDNPKPVIKIIKLIVGPALIKAKRHREYKTYTIFATIPEIKRAIKTEKSL